MSKTHDRSVGHRAELIVVLLLHQQAISFSGTAVFCKLLENTIIRTESPGMKTGQHCIASVLLLSALQMSSAVQCPTGTVRVVNGELAFPKVSQVNFSMIPESSSGMLGGWYAMAGDFVDAVRPGGLPYSIIQGAIEGNNLPCDVISPRPPECDAKGTQSGSFDIIAVFQSFTEWWTGILVVFCIGLLVGVGFLVAGCVFLCCRCCCYRCCGRCGTTQSQKWHRRNDLIMGVVTVILVIFTLGLLVSSSFVFATNEQSYQTWDNVQGTVDQVFNLGINYVQDILGEGTALICHFTDVSLLVLDEVDLLFKELTTIVAGIGQDITDILNSLRDIAGFLSQDSIDAIKVLLNDIQSISSTLVSLGSSLNNRLSDAETLAISLKSSCESERLNNILCDTISIEFGSSFNFSGIPDVSLQIASLTNTTIGTINLTTQIEEGFVGLSNATEEVARTNDSIFADVRSEVTTFLNETVFEVWTNTIISGVEEVLDNTYEIEDCLGTFPEIMLSPSVTIGEIRQCLLNSAINEIKSFDTYRYAFGIVVAVLSLVVVLFMLVGVCVGVAGFRRKRPPPQRTSLSHCGGTILLIGVGLAFVFGFCLIVVSAVGFFLGSNAQKVCESFASPRYELFSEVVDNTTLWHGSLLGSFFFGNASLQFSLSEALRNCEKNQALYRALNLSNIIDLERQLFSDNETLQTINSDIMEACNTLVENFPPDVYLPTTTQNSIVHFSQSGLDRINTNEYRQVIDVPILNFDLNATIQNLTDLQLQFELDMNISLANATGDVIAVLVEVRDSLSPIRTELNRLESKVDQLTSFFGNSVIDTISLAGKILFLSHHLVSSDLVDFVEVLTGPHTQNIYRYIGDFIEHTRYHITDKLGQCRPFHEMYAATHNVLCVSTLNGLNGFWWSVGFCSILFMPIIVLAVISSRFYAKTRPSVASDITESDITQKNSTELKET